MQSESYLVEAFRVLDAKATIEDLKAACRALVIDSDMYYCALPQPLSSVEVSAVVDGMFRCITESHVGGIREITFEIARPVLGKSIDCLELASNYSLEMLFQAAVVKYEVLDAEEAVAKLKAFLAAIHYRYRYCVIAEELFPISIILDFAQAAVAVRNAAHRTCDLSQVLYVVLQSLKSLESVKYGEQL